MSEIIKTDNNKPADFLRQVNKFFYAKLASQVSTIEEMLYAHMEDFVLANGTEEDLKEIQFHMELEQHEFRFKPHNLFTYLLSEGIFVSPGELGINFLYRNADGIYKFDADQLKGYFISQKLIGGTT